LNSQPFFSIGVPTYNRHELLRETLKSIISQGFTDFEVIVGNDYTCEILSGDSLGVTDPRIRYINHPVNLREVGNMNALLATARGRYFTWLFDDDLYEPDFLLSAYTTLRDQDYPPALYTSYRVIDDTGQTLEPLPCTKAVTICSGAEFLDSYFSGRLKLNSTCGIFETAALAAKVGGVEELCESAIGLYCEYLFLVRCGQFGTIVHLDIPGVIFRAHSASWGEGNTELVKYLVAGKNMLRRCGSILQNIDARKHAAHLIALGRMHLITFSTKLVLFEISSGNTGIDAKFRAIKSLSRELAVVRSEYVSQTPWTFQAAVTFLKMRVHCYRFILGKFRTHR
jgi:hypothetical protein